MSLSLLLALVLAPAPASVELERATWEGLRAPSPVEQAVPAWAANRAITLTPVAGGVLLRARWELRSLSQGAWFSGQVLGDMPGLRLEELRWDGKPAAVAVGGDGVTVAGKVSGRARLGRARARAARIGARRSARIAGSRDEARRRPGREGSASRRQAATPRRCCPRGGGPRSRW